MSFWITGSSGFIGTHLSRTLAAAGKPSYGFDLNPGQYTQRTGDLRHFSPADWDAHIQGTEAVFHLAATVSIPACQENPVASQANNVAVTLSLLEALRREKKRIGVAPRLFFASSAAIYGVQGDDGRRLRESDVPDRFLSFYAAQKFASEQLLHQYYLAFGIPTLSFRFFNVYGPGQDPASPYSGVLSRFLHFLKEGQPLLLQGGGSAIRDFVHVTDISRALVLAANLDPSRMQGQAVNLASGSSVSIREVALEIQKIIQASQPTRWPGLAEAPARAGDVRVSTAEIQRAIDLLGFGPQVSLTEGLSALFA